MHYQCNRAAIDLTFKRSSLRTKIFLKGFMVLSIYVSKYLKGLLYPSLAVLFF